MLGMSAPNIFFTPGESFRVLASSSTLRKHLTDAYWCHNMELVCDGKLEGEVIRSTGKELVMMRFPSQKTTRSGKRFDYAFSIPTHYLVPVNIKRALGTSYVQLGASVTFAASVPDGTLSGEGHSPNQTYGGLTNINDLSRSVQLPHFSDAFIPHLCVVCGRWDLPGEVRRHGYKCNGCIGVKSVPRLREESIRLKTEVES